MQLYVLPNCIISDDSCVINLFMALQMKEFFSGERLLLKKPSYYQTDESPDLWFPPELVWEIRGAGIPTFQCFEISMHLHVISEASRKAWFIES